MDNVTTLHPLRAHPVEIDDSRMQTIWARQSRRQTLLAAALGTTAILLGIAAVIVAIRMNIGTATIPAPIVNITNPPPTINVGSGSPPAGRDPGSVMAPRDGETKVVQEYTQFTTATVGDQTVVSGWKYKDSTTDKPYEQYCYILPSRTTRLVLAFDRTVNPELDLDAAANGITPEQARTYLKSCRWHQ